QGVLRSLPFSVDYWILYWNKELFEAKGLKYPESFEQLVAAAEALTDPSTNTYGFVARGLKNANTPVWTSLMLGYDMTPLGSDGKLRTTSAEAVEAAG
ncbi:extracellular solute-binding protein, partial [bacterium M00.F.Ca.ET.179.01.1.1]